MIDFALEDHDSLSPSSYPIVKYYWTENMELHKQLESHEPSKPLVIVGRDQFSPIKPARFHSEARSAEIADIEVQPVIESHFNRMRMSYDHKGRVTFVCFSNDGKRIATGCSDKFVRIFEVIGCKEIFKTISHEGDITSVCFSTDGNYLVTSSMECVVRIFHVSSGNRNMKTVVQESKVLYACFSPSGRSVATGSKDNVARIVDVDTGKTVLVTTEHEGHVTYVWFSPDARYFITRSSDNLARVFSCEELDAQPKRAVSPCMIFPANQISFASHGVAWRMAILHDNTLQVLSRPHNFIADSSLPASTDLVLLWSGLKREHQKQWSLTDSKVVLSEFVSPNGGALVALASKCQDTAFPHVSSTLKRLFESEEPVVNAGLILRELIGGTGTEPGIRASANAAIIHTLLRNVGRHIKFATRDDKLTQEIIRATKIPCIQQHILHEFWTELVGPVLSHPVTVHNVNQVTFSRTTRMYVAGSDFACEPVFESHFERYPPAKGLSLEFEHWIVPFPSPTQQPGVELFDTMRPSQLEEYGLVTPLNQDISGVNHTLKSDHNVNYHRDSQFSERKLKSLMQVLIETNDIDLSASFLIARAIVQFKWQMYGLKHWMKECYVYTINLVALVALSIFIWRSNLNSDFQNSFVALSALIMALDIRSAYRETKQFIHGIPCGDGKTSLLRRIFSSSHYAKFWNWIELLHILLGFSVCILLWMQSPLALPVLSVTCFVRWWGLLFYIQVTRCVWLSLLFLIYI